MKHCFFVSSNLTFFIMHKIVQVKGLLTTDCIPLLVRNYKIVPSYKHLYPNAITTSYNVDPKTGRVFAGWRMWQTRRNIADFDALVDKELQGEDFIFYTSVCSNDICSLMVSKPNCKGYYVTEDGLASYRNYNPQTFTGIRYVLYRCLLLPAYPRIFCVKNHFITTDHPKFRGCIATRQDCFPLHQEYLQVVGTPFDPATESNLPDAVISVDPWYNELTTEQTDQLYKRLSDIIQQKHYRYLACKLHPRFEAPQNAEYKQQYVDILNKYFPHIEFLPADCVLESVLCTAKQDFYFGFSSVALYVSQSGVKCYTFMPWLKDTSVWTPMPDVLQKTATPLEAYN